MKICLMEMMVYLQIYTWLKFHMAQGNSETRFRKRRRKIMYRQYEDPYFLENRLKELKQMYRDADVYKRQVPASPPFRSHRFQGRP